MTEQGEVKFKVRQLANSLGEFTVKHLSSITGLNESSIRTELDRMLEAGYLMVDRTEPLGKGRKGRPISVYKVVADPVKRTELMQSIMAFYPRSQEIVVSKPESPHYLEAVAILEQQLDRAQKGMQPSTDQLALAQEHLSIAEDDEAIGERAAEVIGAWITLEKAKVKALMGHAEEAIQLRDDAQQCFREAGLSDGVSRPEDVDEYIWAGEMATVLSEAEVAQMKHDHERASEYISSLVQLAERLGHTTPSNIMIIRLGRLLHGSLLMSAELKSMIYQGLSSEIDETVGKDASDLVRMRMSLRWEEMGDHTLEELFGRIPSTD